MAWTKDSVTQSPLIVYTNTDTAANVQSVIHDSGAECPWRVHYRWLRSPGETLAEVEADLPGLEA